MHSHRNHFHSIKNCILGIVHFTLNFHAKNALSDIFLRKENFEFSSLKCIMRYFLKKENFEFSRLKCIMRHFFEKRNFEFFTPKIRNVVLFVNFKNFWSLFVAKVFLWFFVKFSLPLIHSGNRSLSSP